MKKYLKLSLLVALLAQSSYAVLPGEGEAEARPSQRTTTPAQEQSWAEQRDQFINDLWDGKEFSKQFFDKIPFLRVFIAPPKELKNFVKKEFGFTNVSEHGDTAEINRACSSIQELLYNKNHRIIESLCLTKEEAREKYEKILANAKQNAAAQVAYHETPNDLSFKNDMLSCFNAELSFFIRNQKAMIAGMKASFLGDVER